MQAWLAQLILLAIGPLREAINAIFDRIAVLFSLIITAGINIRNGWRQLINSARHKLAQLRGLAQQAWATMWWIIAVRIPQVAGSIIDRIVSWVLQTISDARNALESFIKQVIEWARTELARLEDFIGRVLAWARQEIVDIVTKLTFVVGRVISLLLDPAHMAEWVFGALWRKFISYVNENAEALLDFILQRGVFYAGRVAARLEEILVRLL